MFGDGFSYDFKRLHVAAAEEMEFFRAAVCLALSIVRIA
jgi:hypothetical protein